MVKKLSLPSTVLTILKVVPCQMCIYWFSNMDFQFCQPKFGALPVLQEYPFKTKRILLNWLNAEFAKVSCSATRHLSWWYNVQCYTIQGHIFIIQRCGKANETYKSRSPVWSQSIPLLYPQLERPPGIICLEDLRKRHEAAFNLVPPSPLSHGCLWQSSSNWN